MIKRMVLVVRVDNLDSWLLVNDLVIGLVPAGTTLELPIHEYLKDGLNQFKLVSKDKQKILALEETRVSVELQLRHGALFSVESGRQTILQKTRVVPKQTNLAVEPLLNFEHHIQVAFPRWHCFSSLGCSKTNGDVELAESFLKALLYKFLLQDLDGICRVFSHRNQELAVAYGVEVAESVSRFKNLMQGLLMRIDKQEQPALADKPVLFRLGQSSVFYPTTKLGLPAFCLKLKEADQPHFIPMHLAVHEQQVFIVR